MVRTKRVGHIRDVRRLIVAMSRARLGLYVFCRADLFGRCAELHPAFSQLLQRPKQLQLVPQETYPTVRKNTQEPSDILTVTDFRHFGTLIQSLSEARVQQ